MRQDAIDYENKRENYLCKHNNIKYKGLGVEGYIEITKVRECKQPENIEFWSGKRVWLGLDLSLSDDNVSVAMATEHEGMIYGKVWGFIPAGKKGWKTKKEGVDYARLIRQGVCFECGDEVIDYGFIERFIMDIPQKYGVEIVQVGYDRWNALSTVQKLEASGFECVEVKQHSSVLHMPTKLLKEKILEKAFRYDDNLMLEINFQNARCTRDTNLNMYVNKKRSSGKVDMVMGLISATYLLQQDMLYSNQNFGAQY
jgi:phage terminase large subunit-like protein